jgi:hypothetical protein
VQVLIEALVENPQSSCAAEGIVSPAFQEVPGELRNVGGSDDLWSFSPSGKMKTCA